ncbi:MAG: acyl-phosphate glycerol 3-phosphate acyltransferase [Pyrinomonas sp.]|uniref:glycerol-3-phosphate 1-O-acyltransferase PlsY n=1 Tax=Pyrinomonas sp. TaxID=2080306 RepID=UPI003330DF41
MKPLLLMLVAYWLGSIPFGYLIVKLVRGDDVRRTGSGGTGATNVTRRAGKLAGLITLFLDAAKGAAAVLLARRLGGADAWVAVAGVTAIFGHIFPVWLGFRGGKGVATGLGVFVALTPVAVLLLAPIFLAVVLTTRYVSLGSITSAAALPFVVWWLKPNDGPLIACALASSALVIWAHRSNIGRLIAGTESRFGARETRR